MSVVYFEVLEYLVVHAFVQADPSGQVAVEALETSVAVQGAREARVAEDRAFAADRASSQVDQAFVLVVAAVVAEVHPVSAFDQAGVVQEGQEVWTEAAYQVVVATVEACSSAAACLVEAFLAVQVACFVIHPFEVAASLGVVAEYLGMVILACPFPAG